MHVNTEPIAFLAIGCYHVAVSFRLKTIVYIGISFRKYVGRSMPSDPFEL